MKTKINSIQNFWEIINKYKVKKYTLRVSLWLCWKLRGKHFLNIWHQSAKPARILLPYWPKTKSIGPLYIWATRNLATVSFLKFGELVPIFSQKWEYSHIMFPYIPYFPPQNFVLWKKILLEISTLIQIILLVLKLLPRYATNLHKMLHVFWNKKEDQAIFENTHLLNILSLIFFLACQHHHSSVTIFFSGKLKTENAIYK
jgi:hypothetical protein